MGTWGPGIYENDIALDVKDSFERLLEAGKTAEEITDRLTEQYRDAIDDPIDGQAFWFALADVQWEHGVLLPSVKMRAVLRIDSDRVMTECQAGESTEDARELALHTLKEKLLSPPPSAKLPPKLKGYVCQWKRGDVFAFLLESDLAREKGLFGRYALIQKVDEAEWYPDRVVPIVYVKLTPEGILPTNAEEYDRMEYVQTSLERYERRFWPIDMRRPKEDVEEKSKIRYETDEYGFLPEFRIILLNTSKRVIPKKLIYLGNFPNCARPNKEFVPHAAVNIGAVSWGKNGIGFEETVIKKYLNHNLRELSIYHLS